MWFYLIICLFGNWQHIIESKLGNKDLFKHFFPSTSWHSTVMQYYNSLICLLIILNLNMQLMVGEHDCIIDHSLLMNVLYIHFMKPVVRQCFSTSDILGVLTSSTIKIKFNASVMDHISMCQRAARLYTDPVKRWVNMELPVLFYTCWIEISLCVSGV